MSVARAALLSVLSMVTVACGGGDTGGSGGAGGSSQPATTGGQGGRADGGGGSGSASDGGGPAGGGNPGGGSQAGLHVVGNKILDGDKEILFRGINHSGTEYACIQGNGIFDGPHDEASVLAMKTWNVNVVRVPMNEDCWLGLAGSPAAFSGAAYQQGISDYVDLLLKHGLYVILDLHWTAPGAEMATGQQPMADADHSIDFWKAVAAKFKTRTGVAFDLFNEPFVSNQNTTPNDAWGCWLNGCMVEGFQAAGMQSMVDAVRGTGAKNLILAGGIAYSNDLSDWLDHQPQDPTGNLAAAFHGYNFNACIDQNCWDDVLKPIAAQVPLVSGEIGENDCGHDYIDEYMAWADAAKVSYLAWTWNTWDCSSGPALISDWDGTPTAFGAGYKAHLAP